MLGKDICPIILPLLVDMARADLTRDSCREQYHRSGISERLDQSSLSLMRQVFGDLQRTSDVISSIDSDWLTQINAPEFVVRNAEAVEVYMVSIITHDVVDAIFLESLKPGTDPTSDVDG
jgi:hypothetical protein